jgi:hypothetical protein
LLKYKPISYLKKGVISSVMNFGVIQQISEGIADGSLFINRNGYVVDYQTGRLILSLNPGLSSQIHQIYQNGGQNEYTLTNHIFKRGIRKSNETI